VPWLLLVAEAEKQMHHYFIHLEGGRNKNLVAKTLFNRDFQLNVGHPRCLDSLDQGTDFGCLSEPNMISKAFEVCPSLLLIQLLFFMSSQRRDQRNTLIPHILFQGEGASI